MYSVLVVHVSEYKSVLWCDHFVRRKMELTPLEEVPVQWESCLYLVFALVSQQEHRAIGIR